MRITMPSFTYKSQIYDIPILSEWLGIPSIISAFLFSRTVAIIDIVKGNREVKLSSAFGRCTWEAYLWSGLVGDRKWSRRI